MERNEYMEIKDLLHKQDLKLTRIEERLTDYKEVSDRSNKALEIAKKNSEEIKEIKEKNKWFSRAIVGAVITALVGLLFVYLKLGLGVN